MKTSAHTPVVQLYPEELIRKSWWSFVFSFGIPGAALCLAPVILAPFSPGDEPGSTNLVIGFLLTLVMLIPFLACLFLSANGIHQWLCEQPLSIRLNSNMLTVESRRHIVSIELRDCEIVEGHAHDARSKFSPRWLDFIAGRLRS